jgi:glyoxylase-like metal-dependent hydrolase (beta-lactamase superfamily II)
VGWNTRLVDGRWVPTFPNAKYIFSRREYEFWEAETGKESDPPGSVWRDSCRPVIEAGQALLVDDGWELEDGIWLTPTPGHSPGHVCVNVRSQGRRAVFTGDLMHHALQCVEPDWSTCFCADPAMAARSRRGILEDVADTDTIVVPTHFPGPTAGHVVASDDAWRFRFLDG